MQTVLPRNQVTVLDALRAEPGRSLSAYELLARLEPVGIRAPQTIYRALDSLVAAGLVHRIKSLNAFIACSHVHPSGKRPDHEGHNDHRPAFAVCRDCGAVKELEDDALVAVVGVVAGRTGYRIDERVIELVGMCPACVGRGLAPA
jgi:Fur family zinc uptake transcriptional regulator